jgi:molecular chaperone GrpE
LEEAEKAETPEKPEAPGKPDNPDNPENPDNTETPDNPETPEKPESPEKPADPDWKDLYTRLLADFDNFKKRTARDREDTYRYAESDILRDILPVVDNLALALSSAKDRDEPFVKGVRLVYDTLLGALKDHGAEPFESVGQPLDTEKMEAIAHLPSDTVAEGVVSNEAKRGWTLKGKVLRAAQVVVSAGKPAEAAEEAHAEQPAANSEQTTAKSE